MGTAANTSSKGFTTFRKPLGAYSLRYMAIVNPNGNATNIAITVISNVPVSSGKIPKCLSAKSGVHCVSVRKSQTDTSLKKENDCESKTQIIPMVVRRVIAAQANKNPSIIFSFFNVLF